MAWYANGLLNLPTAYRQWARYLDGKESKYNPEFHGASRYYWENVPIFKQIHRVKQEAQQAEDYYDKTGMDDHYGIHYQSSAIDSAIGALSSPLPFKIPTMARSLAQMYGAEVQLDIAKYRHATQMARRFNDRASFEMAMRRNQDYYDKSAKLAKKWKNAYKAKSKW